MKQLVLTSNGQIPPNIRSSFGGSFSFFEKIKMGGVGSPQIIFQGSDAQCFDLQFYEDKLIYANIELLRSGFVIRLWQGLIFRGIVFGSDEPTKVELISYRIQVKKPNVFAAHLRFHLDGEIFSLFIPPKSFHKMNRFLKNEHFNALTSCEGAEKTLDDIAVIGVHFLDFILD